MPFIQAQTKLTLPNGKVITGYSPSLSVVTTVADDFGQANYKDLVLEYQTGYAGRSCTFHFSDYNGNIAQVRDISIYDPNGAVSVTNSSNSGIPNIKVTSTGKAGLVAFILPVRFTYFTMWDDTGLVNGVGYPALKGFKSFGNVLRDIDLQIVAYNFNVPTQIPATLKTIRFGLGLSACGLFDDPAIRNWDVSNLAANSFDSMFAYCSSFSQDLSGWCVPQVTSPPQLFDYGTKLTAAKLPVWGTCPVVVSPTYTAGYYSAISGGNKITSIRNNFSIYLRFMLDKIPAGTVLTLKAGVHSTPASGYYTDFRVLKANGAIDSSNGVKTRMYGDGSPNREITLTFPNAVANPTEFVIEVNIWNTIYTMDRYGASCTNYVYQGTKAVVSEYLTLTH